MSNSLLLGFLAIVPCHMLSSGVGYWGAKPDQFVYCNGGSKKFRKGGAKLRRAMRAP